MYKSDKSIYVVFFAVSLIVFFSIFFISPAIAEENYTGNIPSGENMMMGMSTLDSIDLPFDPNDYSFLIYNPGGNQPSIESAMNLLGIPYDLRGYVNGGIVEVTPEDLATHDILIVGWNYSGDTTGLHSDDLAAGITGRVILTGHDLDYHTTCSKPAAETMLIQAINYILSGGGTGLITLGCTDAFPYIPGEWSISAVIVSGSEDVNEFTSEGLTSGVYDGLEPENLSNWGQAYHNIFFLEEGSPFVPFEINNDGNYVTIAQTNSILPPGCEVGLSITDDTNECVEPFVNEQTSDYLSYQICYSTTCDLNEVTIEVQLSEAADFNYASGDYYIVGDRTIQWYLGNLTANQSGCFTIRVKVMDAALTNGVIIGKAKMYNGQYVIKLARESTDICCWSGNRLYVAYDAAGYKDGSSWTNAYNTLNQAFEAMERCGSYNEIWIKSGVYTFAATFNVPRGFKIYGGFAGWETDPNQRVLDPNNLAIISGDNTGDGTGDLQYIMNLSDVNNIIIDGIEFTKASNSGISFVNSTEPEIYDSNTVIANCKFTGNGTYGISLSLSYPTIINCIFLNNASAGLYIADSAYPLVNKCSFSGNYYGIQCNGGDVDVYQSEIGPDNNNGVQFVYSWSQITDSLIHDNSIGVTCHSFSDIIIENCCIIDNSSYGVFASDTNPEIYDSAITGNSDGVKLESGASLKTDRCLIAENAEYGIYANNYCSSEIYNGIIRNNQSDGIYCTNTYQTIVKNNWIFNNGVSGGYGIKLNSPDSPAVIQNNTICRNVSGGVYRSGGNDPNIRNCIFWDNASNDLDGTFGKITYCRLSSTHTGTGNITDDPCFVAPDVNNYHIKWQSLCIDAGFTLSSQNYERDIDGEARIFDGDFDTIAKVDMGADECYQSPADINIDDIVNWGDYTIFMQAWRTSTGQLNWNPDCNLEVDGVIDYEDLAKFTNDWLWQTQQSEDGLLEHECQELAQSDWPEIVGQSMMMLSMPSQSPSESVGSYLAPSFTGGSSESVAGLSESAETLSTEVVEYIEPEPFDVNETLNWLDNLWETDANISGSIDANDWQDFLNAIKNSEE